jgi:hypothetical protein
VNTTAIFSHDGACLSVVELRSNVKDKAAPGRSGKSPVIGLASFYLGESFALKLYTPRT